MVITVVAVIALGAGNAGTGIDVTVTDETPPTSSTSFYLGWCGGRRRRAA